ncbi:MAG: NAAT family transporter [Thermodesulfobacteria bacterium]|nr:NAAT family transporter [Thermodesulfobacteriota bacterium]
MLSFILQVFSGFLAIMNPIGNVPVFISLVEEFDEETRRRVAKKAVIGAFIICSLFVFTGNFIFRFFGITLPAFRIAGGILVFLIAYQLLRGKPSRQHHPGEEEHEEADPDSIAITPLATPILAGPGTITTAMSFAGSRTHFYDLLLIIGVFGVVCLLTYYCFVYGEAISNRLGRTKIGVITRLMGLILAVIAVQMILEGLREAFPYLASGTISKS